jgi:putative spermidine/putrescine transport system permease protein
VAEVKQFPLWKWFWIGLGVLYFWLPLLSTLIFSLKKKRDMLSFAAYGSALAEPAFLQTFSFSLLLAVLTIVVGVLLIVPTAYWVHLYLPKFRSVMEVLTLLPFVIPPIILVFGLIRTYSQPPLLLTSTKATTAGLLVAGYTVISLPYMYRSVDLGLRAMDVRGLTEAAQSLGASWPRILFGIVLPNLRTALVSGALLTLAIVVGEVTMASFLGLPTFGPYLFLVQQHQAFESGALTMVAFTLTWIAMGLLSVITSGLTGRQAQVAGGH